MPIKEGASSAAPPIRPPSTLGFAKSSAALDGLQLPPYNMDVFSATSFPYFDAIVLRIWACMSSAWSAVAVLPVPIAHTGS